MFNLKERKTANLHTFRSNHQRLKLFLVILLAIVVTLIPVTLKSPYFKIKKVSISPDNLSCATQAQILQNITFFNQNFFLVSYHETSRKLQKKFICIKEVTFDKRWPDKIEINLSERQPKAIIGVILPKIATPSSQEAKLDFSVTESSVSARFVVDEDGFVFSQDLNGLVNLPIIYIYDDNIKLSKIIRDHFVKNTLAILKKLSDLSVEVKLTKIDGEKLLIDAETKLVFSLSKDINYQLASLQLIWQKAKMDSKAIDQIDLRFDKPVMIFPPKK